MHFMLNLQIKTSLMGYKNTNCRAYAFGGRPQVIFGLIPSFAEQAASGAVVIRLVAFAVRLYETPTLCMSVCDVEKRTGRTRRLELPWYSSFFFLNINQCW